ncbi:uncharacterized protein SAPINGB_P000071 [Magnusiomyces paraingens]|uniref:CNH domain-containing protein n=1 Tax=Magnusiomyces paraingens TaxID=2606893 RepID=A0A5E8AYE7_9ASCO|nr:uncharacterized protein SAPINGB_P000071 [Saprochaete ingens]VVT43629.1 unnamed protein product [Saprochaete ingens]
METFPGNNGVLSGENFFINLFTPTGITIKKGAGYEEFRCATQYDNGKRSLFVSNIGIYYLDRPVKEFASRYPKKGDPPISLPLKKVIDLENITQVDAVKEYNMLFVLSKSTLYSGPILINYNKFSFYVDDYGRLLSKHGNRGLDLIFYWKSSPNAFSISYPYVFAFGENMLEFGHLETGEIGSSIISNPRWFKSSSEQMMYAFKEFDKVNIFDTFALADFSNVVETFSDAPPRTLAILPDNSQSSLVTLH